MTDPVRRTTEDLTGLTEDQKNAMNLVGGIATKYIFGGIDANDHSRLAVATKDYVPNSGSDEGSWGYFRVLPDGKVQMLSNDEDFGTPVGPFVFAGMLLGWGIGEDDAPDDDEFVEFAYQMQAMFDTVPQMAVQLGTMLRNRAIERGLLPPDE